jgi:8-oxo-dGTP pyrophosphatase MutT (NUDIX family)
MKKIIPASALLVPAEATRVFEGVIFDIYHWQQTLFDGTEDTFEMLKRHDTVVSICIVEDKIIVLDDEQPHEGHKKSFPGGHIDKTDATVLEAAQRETKEESGYSFDNWKLVLVRQPYNKVEWFIHFFVAWDIANITEPKNDPGEKTKVNLVSIKELKEKIRAREGYLGEDRDLFTGVDKVQDLLELKEFSGQLVDR